MNNNTKFNLIIFLIGLVLVIWVALLIAPISDKGIIDIIGDLSTPFEHPFKIVWCKNSIKTIFLFLIVYAFIIFYFIYSKKNYRHRIEYGSAK